MANILTHATLPVYNVAKPLKQEGKFTDSIVKQSNELSRGRWKPSSRYETSLVALVASKVRQDDQDFKEYEIPYHELSGHKPDGRTHKLIKDAAMNLVSKVVEIQKPNGGWKACTIFCEIEYCPSESVIKAKFAPAMKPHYLDLSKHFTEFPLIEYMSLPSLYSQKIYGLLRSWDDQQEITMGIKELHDILQTKSHAQRSYAEFNRRILKPAHKHISELTSLKYEYEPIKKGRKYTEIKFTFGYKKRTESKKKNQKNDAKKNNDLFKESLKCWNEKSNECDSKSQSKKCKICRSAHQRINL